MDECVRLTCNVPNRLVNTLTNLLAALNIKYKYTYDVDDVNAMNVDNAKNEPFTAPTLEEVKKFCEDGKYNINSSRFWSYYTQNNWHEKNGTPVTDWKAKIISWAGNGLDRNYTQPSASTSGKTTYRQDNATVISGVEKTMAAFKEMGI